MDLPHVIQFRKNDYDSELRKVAAEMSFVNGMIKQVADINGIEFNQALLQDLFQANGYATRDAIAEKAADSLAKAGIKTAALIEMAKHEDTKKFDLIRSAIPGTQYAYAMVFRDGIAVINPNFLEELKGRFTLSIKSEKGMKLYLAHKAAIEAFNKIFELAPELKRASIIQIMSRSDVHFGDVKINFVDYDRLAV